MTARIPASRRRRVISLLYLCLLLVLGLGAGGAAAGSPRPRRLPADNTAPVAPPLPRQAGNDSAPACLVDAVALSVAGFSFAARTATAELRVLAVCSSQMGVTDVLRLVGPQGDGSVQVSAQGGAPLPAEAQAQLPGMVWMAAAQYRADVRARFELKYYPFDRIRVPVALEATKPWGDMEVRFGLLDANPGSRIGNGFFTDEALMLQGLPIVVAGNFGYVPDSFGAQAPEFARFTFEYEFRRDDVTTFVQVMLASYLAFMLSVSSLALPVEEHFDSRMGILGASIFVVVLTMSALSTFLGYPATMTLGDYITLSTLFLIGLIFVESICEKWLVLHRRAKEDDAEALHRAFGNGAEDVDGADKAAAEGTNGALRHRGPRAPAGAGVEMPVVDAPPRRSVFCFGACPRPKGAEWMSLWTAVTVSIAYVGINVGLLVGYRAPPGG